MVLRWNGAVAADIPLAPLADEAPLYDRPWVATPKPAPLADVPDTNDAGADLVRLMGSPDLASRRWIWEQYDHMVGADTVQRPGGDAAVVRVHGTDKGLAISTDVTPRYCFADPVEGGKQAIAECYRNISAVGAKPLATTDCMNFGNPQRPEIMGQFVGCIEGMAEACRALDFPIVSGNVSLYNETKNDDGSGSAILPTPAIGGVGLLDDWRKSATIAFKAEGEVIWMIGGGWGSHLGQSLWLREIAGREEGPPPPVDLEAERRAGELVRAVIGDGLVSAVHDCADGGALVAIAEMALAGDVGAQLSIEPSDVPLAARLFGEDQGRYVVTVPGSDARAIERARQAGLEVVRLGVTGGNRIASEGDGFKVALADLRRAHEGFFPTLMGPDAALA
jgi:phosphoribosylformylglycinamidine synthase II